MEGDLPFEEDIALAREAIECTTGMRPNVVMLGEGPAEMLGVKPGVYVQRKDGIEYFTFEEWERGV